MIDKENRRHIFLLTFIVLFFPVSFIILENVDFSKVSNSYEVVKEIKDELKDETVYLSSKKQEYISDQTKIISTDKQTSTLLFVGDIMLSRGINQIMESRDDRTFPFANIVDFLKEADLVFGNLEGPISTKGYDTGSLYSFRANPLSIEGLLFAGFDVLSLANNHMLDYSTEALVDTFRNLNLNKISYIGAGHNFEEAHTPVVKDVNDIEIAFLAYTNLLPQYAGSKDHKPNVAYPNKEQVILDINKAKQVSDFVVVSIHWGDEYKTSHNEYQQDLAYFVIDNGADLVIGHHPHVVQELEKYKDGYIAYSLGNFVFDQNFSEDTRNGMILEVTLDKEQIVGVRKYRIEFNNAFQPFIIK